jgi:hypothetical protein
MKKVSIILNFILIGIIAVMASSMSPRFTAGSVSFKTCVDCTTDSFYGLTLSEFMKGVARYRKTHWDLINSDPYMLSVQSGGLKDARACWYSIDTLKKFICLIEKYSSGLGLTSDKLGIRFYYATYPYKGTWNQSYLSHHTLFMVPTYRDDSTKYKDNIDFDPRFDVQAKKGVLPMSQIGSKNGSVQILVLDGGTANSTPPRTATKNQGQLCPPTCPTSSSITTNNMMQYIDQTYPLGLNWRE